MEWKPLQPAAAFLRRGFAALASPSLSAAGAAFLRARLLRGLLRLLGLLRRRASLVDQLHQRHRRCVARAGLHLEDAGIAAGARLEARADVLEQLAHDLVVPQLREGAAAPGEAVRLAQRDQRLDDAPQLLGLGQGSANRLVPQQRCGHVAHQRLAVRGVARQLAAGELVTHGCSFLDSSGHAVLSSSSRRRLAGGQPSMRMPSVRPWLSSTSLISVSDFLPRFGVLSSSTSVRCTRSPM